MHHPDPVPNDIGEPPLNDIYCLTRLHAAARKFSRTPEAIAMAANFDTEKDIVDYIRSLPQRNDTGDPLDGPRVQCDVAQRLRLPATDPACYERTGMFIGLMRNVAPHMRVTSATIRVDDGLHTFPVVLAPNGPRVVILDPRQHHLRNAMTATAYQLRNVSPMASERIAPWFIDTTRRACIDHGIGDVFDSAVRDIRNGLVTGQPLEYIDDVEHVLSIAAQEAQLFGPAGHVAYRRVHDSIRNLSINLSRKQVGKFIRDLAKRAEPVASDVLKAALIAKFGPAASIALEGVALDASKPDPESDVPDAKNKAKKKTKPTREERLRRLRRMTLAFRDHPQPKES